MPARSVVIEKLSKFTGEHHEFLTPGEYTQLTGRAGRRGIDDVGYAIVCWSPFVPFDQVAGLASRRTVRADVVVPPDLQHGREPRRPLPGRRRPPPAQPLVRAVPGRPRRRRPGAPARAQPGAAGAPAGRRGLRARRRRASTGSCSRPATRPGGTRGGGRQITDAIDALRPGDVLTVRRGGGRAVVLKHEGSRGGARGPRARLEPRRVPARPRGLRPPTPPDRQHRAAQAVRAPELRRSARTWSPRCAPCDPDAADGADASATARRPRARSASGAIADHPGRRRAPSSRCT